MYLFISSLYLSTTMLLEVSIVFEQIQDSPDQKVLHILMKQLVANKHTHISKHFKKNPNFYFKTLMI